MSYLPHQIEKSDELYGILKVQGIAYLQGLPRSGKTRTALRVAEMSKAKNVLVLCPKAAIDGWQSELAAISLELKYNTNIIITNYEQVHKLTQKFDLLVLDEAHRLGKVGKPTKRVKDIRKLTYELPALLLSGTPVVETPLSIFYQCAVTKYSPFNFKTFYDFFREFGIPSPTRINGIMIEQYKKSKPELLPLIDAFAVKMTQDDAGISCQAEDKVHYVKLEDKTWDLINKIKNDQIATIDDELVPFESTMAERVALHQIESGMLKVGEKFVDLGTTEIVDYVMKTFGDTPDVAIMMHYHSTRMKFEQHFKHSHIYSSNRHAEGVDLSKYKHFVIINGDYSGAKFLQRRERIVNINKTGESIVNHIMVKGGLSEMVYKTVSKKRDFNNSIYRRNR